jgi:hypothetical protein
MESESFRSRVVGLIQKSRRALRLYTHSNGQSLARVEGMTADLSAAQVSEWREINGLLLKRLSESADTPSTKKLVYDVFALRNEFQTLWRTSEGELVQLQRELVAAAERGDFIKATGLSSSLVSLKARVQAGQAAHHELDLLIKRSRVVRPAAELGEDGATVLSTIELLDEQSMGDARNADAATSHEAIPPKVAVGAGKVIPLKRRES